MEKEIIKQKINVLDCASEIMNAVSKGVLVTTKSGDKINSMTISWGMLGIEWGKPIFVTFIREGRFTRKQLDESMEFTVNIPRGEFDKKITAYCGSHSGRDTDKIKDLGLTLVESENISAPAIKELPLTLECRVLYKQLQDKDAIPQEIREKNYPANVGSDSPLGNCDYHIAYYGEIVDAYVISSLS